MKDTINSSNIEQDKETNSYCIEYCNNEFFLGLANKGDDSLDVKGYLKFDIKFFNSFFQDILKAIVKYQEKTGKDFLKELKEEEEEEV